MAESMIGIPNAHLEVNSRNGLELLRKMPSGTETGGLLVHKKAVNPMALSGRLAVDRGIGPESGDACRMSDRKKSAATIIVVDPDVLVRAAISEYLRHCGYHVIEARSGEEAMQLIAARKSADIVFTEVKLPGMSGFELAKTLRAQHAGISILLTSGVEGAAETAGDLCDDGPLPKPYSHEEVVRRIRMLRERKRSSGG
jgi:CheY-like chemotaxis protein